MKANEVSRSICILNMAENKACDTQKSKNWQNLFGLAMPNTAWLLPYLPFGCDGSITHHLDGITIISSFFLHSSFFFSFVVIFLLLFFCYVNQYLNADLLTILLQSENKNLFLANFLALQGLYFLLLESFFCCHSL